MNKVFTQIAKRLRRNRTEAEKFLWYEIRSKNLGVKFRRQAVIGRYIVDFVYFERNLIIEIDGRQHAENKADQQRERWFRAEGFKVLRF